MSNDTLDKLIWVLVYAGLFVGGLGIWFVEHQPGAGWTLTAAGGAMVVVAALLLWLRSRRS